METTLIYQYTNIQSGNVVYSMWEDRFEDEIRTGHVCQRSFPIDDFEEYVDAISPISE